MIGKNKKGITFLEVIVATFVSVLVITASVVAFSKFFSSYRTNRSMQKNVEEAQYAMNLMAKSLRTGGIVYCGTGTNQTCEDYYSAVRFFDYSQDKCIGYIFDGEGNLKYAEVSKSNERDDPETWCGEQSFSHWLSVNNSGYFLNGKFYIVRSSFEEVGKVSILMEICSDSDCSDPAEKVNIQTSVSLRNYEEVEEAE